MNTADKIKLKIPIKYELILFIIIFGLTVFLRFNHLAADPPDRISFSQGINTDPPAYTLFARNAELTGDWNPYHDYRFATHHYSVVSAFARIVFDQFGVGVYQANLTAALMSLVSILLFYLIARKVTGNGTALLMLLFIGLNFLAIFFGRRPFLEVGMNFLFISGLFFLTYMEKGYLGHILFGILTASSIVFGKMIGLGFVGVPVINYSYRFFLRREKGVISQAAFMTTGFMAVFLLWFMIIFKPYSESMTGYVGEQALGLHGTPEGLMSVGQFIWKLLVFGRSSEFFDRMPAISFASLVIFIIIAGTIFNSRRGKSKKARISPLVIAIVAWLVGTYLFQMPWNYQPVRYQTTLIFPLALLSATMIVWLYNSRGIINILNRSIIFGLIFMVTLTILIYQSVANFCTWAGYGFTFTSHMIYIMAIVGPIWILYLILAWRKNKLEIYFPPLFRYTIISLVVVVFLVYQGQQYVKWAKTPLYTTRDASRDLAMILSPGAVIAGPYGPALTLENNHGSLTHTFGVMKPDTLLFKRFPITHIAVDKTNIPLVKEHYPEIMNGALLAANYYINCRRVYVYRISRHAGSKESSEYLPSNLERAVQFYRKDMSDSGDFYLDRFQLLNPDNINGNFLAGMNHMVLGEFDDCVNMLSRAVDFSPTDFNIHLLLGQAYISWADSTQNDSLFRIGKKELALATRLNLGYNEFDSYLGLEVKETVNGKIEPPN